jgi:hypothetical protein
VLSPMLSVNRGLNTPRDTRKVSRYQYLHPVPEPPPRDDLRYDLLPFGRIRRSFSSRSISGIPAFLSLGFPGRAMPISRS